MQIRVVVFFLTHLMDLSRAKTVRKETVGLENWVPTTVYCLTLGHSVKETSQQVLPWCPPHPLQGGTNVREHLTHRRLCWDDSRWRSLWKTEPRWAPSGPIPQRMWAADQMEKQWSPFGRAFSYDPSPTPLQWAICLAAKVAHRDPEKPKSFKAIHCVFKFPIKFSMTNLPANPLEHQTST